jgi:hypothetical protein
MFVFEIRVRIVKTLLIAGFLLSTVNAMAEAVLNFSGQRMAGSCCAMANPI